MKNKMIARWHFRMLNDKARNLAFKKAIQFSIREKEKLFVMDIGSGTGLLSLYAAKVLSTKQVYAIECSEVMSKISTKVFSATPRGKVVQVIEKHSMDLVVGKDIPEKVDLVVSETLDCAAFGEGILDTLIHAKENLLNSSGLIVPWKVKIHIAGYRSKTLCANQCLVNDGILESIFLGNLRLVARNDEPYDAEYVDNIADFKLVTGVKDGLVVEFNDLTSMRQHFEGAIEKQFELNVQSEGYLDGFVTWFTLFLNQFDGSNIFKTAPMSGSCWPQAIFKMKKRVKIMVNSVLKVSMSCKDGVLAIRHELDKEPEKEDLEIDPLALRFLNDAEYLRELEFAVGQHKHTISTCLDLTPFPFVGLMLLKEGKIQKLYCKKKDEASLRIIIAANLIKEECLEFLEEPIYDLTLEFDLILLHPFHPLGDLDGQIIVDYQNYKNQLTVHGLIVPRKISLYGELINSKFLIDGSKVTNVDVKRKSIDKFINEYMTEVHLDINSSLKHEKLSAPFKLADIHFDNGFHEKIFDVPVLNEQLPIQAILFHHKIKLTESSGEFSTDRKSALTCFRRTAQVLILESKCPVSQVSVSFQQNTGIVRCDVIG